MGISINGKLTPPTELGVVLGEIRKKYGNMSVVKASTIPQVTRIPTGVFEFDLATGGGFPRGRLSMIYGPESSGKTNICYCAAANAQRQPEPCNTVVWVDLEGSFDPKWAAEFGIDVEAMLVVKPSFGEEAVDMIIAMLYAKEVAMVVIDSIAQMTPSKEIEGEAGDHHPGRAAMLVKRLCNQAVVALSKEQRRADGPHDPALILINQTRFKIGVLHGDPETIPGGNTMKFLSSLTVRLYGKNKVLKEINPELPAFKDTTAVIKKAKVPVLQSAFTYDMALIKTEDGFSVGDTNSWTSVSTQLKSTGALVKLDSGGWKLFGTTHKLLASFQDLYRTSPEFRLQCQSKVVESMKKQAILIEASGAAA